MHNFGRNLVVRCRGVIVGVAMLFVALLVAHFLIKHYGIDFVLKYLTIVGIIFGFFMSLYGLYSGYKEK